MHYETNKRTRGVYDYLLVFISFTIVLISFLKFGFTLLFIKAMFLDCILIVASLQDFKYRIIPDNLVIITAVVGIIFTFICRTSLVGALIGMFVGGGTLFLLALVPNAIGGGDIKWMFALGSFLETQKVFEALFLAFILAALISGLLLIFKIKGRKDYIPFGPFLAIGCFLSFHTILLL